MNNKLNLGNLVARITNKMFRKIDGVQWDLMTGQIGIPSKEGLRTLTTDTDAETGAIEYRVAENPLDLFEFRIPAFAIGTPLEQVQPGDLVVFKDNNTFGWVSRKLTSSLDILKGDGTSTNYKPNKVVNALLGGEGGNVLVVRSLLTLGGGEAGLGSLQNNLLPLLMLGGDNGALDDILPLMLFSNMNPAGAAANPLTNMLPLMLLQKAGGGEGGLGGIDPMMLVMMSGGGGLFGGGAAAGANPMANMLPLLLLSKGGKGGGFFG